MSCLWPPDQFTHDLLRISKLFLTFTSILLATVCVFAIRQTPSISREYANMLVALIIVATQFDVYSQLIFDPQYTTSTFCVYQDAPLLSIHFNAAWGFIIWIFLVTLNPPIYAACFIHRHQLVVPSDSWFKLHPFARKTLLVLIAIPCLAYGYSYYLAWDPQMKWKILPRMTADWDPAVLARLECIPDARELRAAWGFALFFVSITFVTLISSHTFSILRKARNISDKTRSSHRIMMQSLIALAAVPIVFIVIPFTIVGYYYMFMNIFALNLRLMDYGTLVNAFHSSVHSTVLILTTPVFRKLLTLCGRTPNPAAILPSIHLYFSSSSQYFTAMS